MRLTTASIKIIKPVLSKGILENLTPTERARRDFEYLQKVKERFSDIEAAIVIDSPDCNPNSNN